MDSRYYPGVEADIPQLHAELRNVFDSDYEVQAFQVSTTSVIQARKSSTLRDLTGLSSALTIKVTPESGGTRVEIGMQKWFDKAAVAAVGAMAFPPLLALAALGAYSVTAYASARRTREYVIRMALGEPRASIVARAIAAAAVPALYGLAAGATAAVVAAPWIQPFLYGTEARDAATIAASVSAILAISLLAALASARAAARSNPAGALQAD